MAADKHRTTKRTHDDPRVLPKYQWGFLGLCGEILQVASLREPKPEVEKKAVPSVRDKDTMWRAHFLRSHLEDSRKPAGMSLPKVERVVLTRTEF